MYTLAPSNLLTEHIQHSKKKCYNDHAISKRKTSNRRNKIKEKSLFHQAENKTLLQI